MKKTILAASLLVLGSSLTNADAINITLPKVAVYGAPYDASWNNDVKAKLLGTAQFSQVDTYGLREATPDLAELSQYSAVMIYSDYGFADPTTLANVLADYVDAGGGVVVATFSYNADPYGFGGGRFITGGYLPLASSVSQTSYESTMVMDLADHPILSGVTNFSGGSSSYRNTTYVTNGGLLVAHWADGLPLVVTRSNVVGLNFYPPSSDVRSDFWPSSTDGARLMANALSYSINPNYVPPVLLAITNQPVGLTVYEKDEAAFSVGATGTSALSYQWQLNGVKVPKATNSTYTVSSVKAKNAGDYTVIVTNLSGAVTSEVATLTIEGNFGPLVPWVGSYNGLFADLGAGPSGPFPISVPSHEHSGFFTAKVKDNAYLSGKLYTDGNKVSFTGRFNPQGTASITVKRGKIGKPDLQLHLSLGSEGAVSGTVSQGECWMSYLSAEQPLAELPPFSQQFTLLMEGFSMPVLERVGARGGFPGDLGGLPFSTNSPLGASFGAMLLKTNGVLKVAGALSDGQAFKQAVPVGRSGTWPVYNFEYKTTQVYTNLLDDSVKTNKSYYAGSIIGQFQLLLPGGFPLPRGEEGPGGLLGFLAWTKPAGLPGTVYVDGFTNIVIGYASPYTPPLFGQRLVDIEFGYAMRLLGDLEYPAVTGILLTEGNKISVAETDDKLKLSVATKTGLLKGAFRHPVTGQPTKIRGAVLQEFFLPIAAGFFVGPTQSGLILVAPDELGGPIVP